MTASVDPPIADEALLELARAGCARSFAALVKRHQDKLLRIARSVLRDDARAEDAMQEAYVAAFTHLHQFEGRSTFSTWMTSILLRAALQGKRQSRHDRRHDALEASSLTTETEGPESSAARREAAALLDEAIDALSPGLREVFVSREVDGLSVHDTARALALSEENVKVRLHRARQSMKQFALHRMAAVRQGHQSSSSRMPTGGSASLAALLTPRKT